MEEKDKELVSFLDEYFSKLDLEKFRERLTDTEIKNLLVSFNYNSLASTVWFNKYANEKLEEKMPAQMHKRMAKVFYDVEEKYYKAEVERLNKGNKSKNLDYLKDNLSDYGFRRTPLSEKSIFKLFARFKYVIPQGSVMSQAGTEEIGSLSNCMVTEAPSDSYGGIMKTDQELAQMFKRRCGAGTDISTLRPAGAGTSNVAKTSTGAVSFMHRFSNTTREVAQGSRRGALMLTMDILHPDIMDFITVKNDLTKVTGANISVKVNDTFMKAVENDEEICLRWPIELEVPERYDDMELNELYTVDGGYVKWTNAKVIWDTLIKSTHATAEPGILFWDQIIKHSPEGFSYPAFTALSTNPCGEIPLPAYDSCRLMALNLTAFVVNKHSPEAFFDFDQFYAAVYEAMRLSDDLVDMELDAVQRIIDKIMKDPEQLSVKKVELDMWNKIYATGKAGRRTGLGFTALGDAAAYLGVTYGGEDFQRILKSLMHTKMKAEFDCSIDLAITRGQFKDYDATQEFYRIDDKYYGANSFYTLMVEEFPEQVERMIKHGRRNISVSTVAPTGSLSMLAEVSSGIEPVFNILHVRRVKVMGTTIDENAIIDDQGDAWTEHVVLHPPFKEWMKNELGDNVDFDKFTEKQYRDAFDLSPWAGSTASELKWEDRIKTQSIVQKYTSHSISSTINLPRETDVATVDAIYTAAWEANLKGVTVYRDGSRDGVLVTGKTDKAASSGYEKRPKILPAVAFTVKAEKDVFSVFVGIKNDKPYEVFAYPGGTKEGPGSIVREAKSEYYFVGDDEASRHRIITGKMTDSMEMITRLLSGSLRHNRDIVYLIKDIDKTSGDMFSFISAIARVLKTFIPDGTKGLNVCAVCGVDAVVYQDGCKQCLNCGDSKCS